jgi:hypothetical protein
MCQSGEKVKTCNKCGQVKSATHFHKQSKVPDGCAAHCKECVRAYGKSRYLRDKEKLNQQNKVWRELNNEKVSEAHKIYYRKNADKIKQRVNGYRIQNQEIITERKRVWKRNKRRTSPLFKLMENLRRRVRGVVLYGSVDKSTLEILGETIEFIHSYLGEPPCGNAHIDHICPLAQAINKKEAEKLCHYTNIQWLTPEENIAKGDKKTPEGEQLCKELLGRDWIDK